MLLIKGISLLVLTLALFSLFSFKAPKGSDALSGLAGAAVATFLVEAILKYICGDFFGIAFLGEVGATVGSLGGAAAAALVCIQLGVNPVFAIVAAVAVKPFGILPGFFAGYICSFAGLYLQKKLPEGIDTIIGSLLIAPLAFALAKFSTPMINVALETIGVSIQAAAEQQPLVMGFLLGGLIKMICTSPLSSMALTAMLGMTGLPMGIAAIACFGGSFTNGIVFKRLKLGDQGKVIAIMLEPLTQAHIVTANALPIYCSNFFGGALAGVAAAALGIVNNAPGTASPIPGLLAPFAFNPWQNVVLALVLGAIGGTLAGFVGSQFFMQFNKKKKTKVMTPKLSIA